MFTRSPLLLLGAMFLLIDPLHARAQSPVADLHDLRWFVHSDLITGERPLSFYEDLIERATADAVQLLQGASGPTDTPCCTELAVISVQAFDDFAGFTLNSIDTQAEADAIDTIGGGGSRAFLVDQIRYCGRPGAPIGCADFTVCSGNPNDDPKLVLVVTVEAQEVGELAGTLAHERGHNACLCHPDDPACNLFPLDQACNVMLSGSGGDCLAEDQCQRYQQGNTGGAQGEVCGCFADDTTIAGDGTSCEAGAGLCSGGVCGEVGSDASVVLAAAGGTDAIQSDPTDDPLKLSGVTGGWTDMGTFGASYEPTGLAYAASRGVLYGVALDPSPPHFPVLFSVDPSDGNVVMIGALSMIGEPVNLAFDPGGSGEGDDVLLALNDNNFANLYAIDPDDANVRLLGSLDFGVPGGVAFPGLAYDANAGVLYASSALVPGGLYTIEYPCRFLCSADAVDADAILFESGLAWSDVTGDLYVLGRQTTRLFYDTIDTTTFETLKRRRIEGFTVGGLAALPVPEPGLAALQVTALGLLLGFAQWRRRSTAPSALLAVALAVAMPPLARAESDVDAAEAMVRTRYYEGLPYEKAQTIGRAGAARLAELLADANERDIHANIVLALGMAARAGAFEALSDAELSPEGEVDRATYRLAGVLPLAMGFLAREDDRALAWLIARARSAGAPAWRFRHARGEALREELRQRIVSGLGLSGRPEARPMLEEIAHEGTGVTARHAAEMGGLNQRLERDGPGLAPYTR